MAFDLSSLIQAQSPLPGTNYFPNVIPQGGSPLPAAVQQPPQLNPMEMGGSPLPQGDISLDSAFKEAAEYMRSPIAQSLHSNPFIMFPASRINQSPTGATTTEPTFFGRHPKVTNALESVLMTLGNMGPPGETPAENISNVARSLTAYPQAVRQRLGERLMMPFEIAKNIQDVRLKEAQAQSQQLTAQGAFGTSIGRQLEGRAAMIKALQPQNIFQFAQSNPELYQQYMNAVHPYHRTMADFMSLEQDKYIAIETALQRARARYPSIGHESVFQQMVNLKRSDPKLYDEIVNGKVNIQGRNRMLQLMFQSANNPMGFFDAEKFQSFMTNPAIRQFLSEGSEIPMGNPTPFGLPGMGGGAQDADPLKLGNPQ